MPNKKQLLKIGTGIITVIVGKEGHQQKFDVHEGLITERSRFFRNAMQGKWKEAEERVVTLEEDDPETFSLYLQALYAGHVDLAEDHQPEEFYSMIGGLFVLAKRLRDVKTKNIVVTEIKEKAKVEDHLQEYLQMASEIYDGTPGPCLVRQLLIDIFAKSSGYHAEKDGLEIFTSKLDGLPNQLLLDLIYGLYTTSRSVYGGSKKNGLSGTGTQQLRKVARGYRGGQLIPITSGGQGLWYCSRCGEVIGCLLAAIQNQAGHASSLSVIRYKDSLYFYTALSTADSLC